MSRSICLNPVLMHVSGDYKVTDSKGHKAGKLGFRHMRESGTDYMLIGGNPGGVQPNTTRQQAAKQAFKEACEQVNAIMKDSAQLATYKAEWAKEKQKKHPSAKTLRGYIFGKVY